MEAILMNLILDLLHFKYPWNIKLMLPVFSQYSLELRRNVWTVDNDLVLLIYG